MINIPVLYISILFNTLDYRYLSDDDVVYLSVTFVTLIFYGALFAYINKNVEEVTV